MSDETPRVLRESVRQLHVVSSRLQNLRALLASERNTPAEQSRAREALEQEMADMAQDDTRSLSARASQLRSSERRRPYVNIPAESQDAARVPSPTPSGPIANGTSPANLVRTRRRTFRPSERLARSHRDRAVQAYAPPATYTRPGSPLTESSNPYANCDPRPRVKRRKLDDGSFDTESKAISYGYKGQVVPGKLKLEISSCDGGDYQGPNTPTNSWPSNVLLDDASVYCTKSNQCNIVFRHASGMPFSLTNIVIKAPRSGYDAPIQEGMIFVAMSDEDILEKTSHFELHYSPRSYRQHRHHFDRALARHEYIHSARSPLRTIDRTRYLRNPHPTPSRYENDPLLERAVIPGFDVTTGPPSEDEATLTTSPPSPQPWRYADPDDSYLPYVDRYRPRYHEPVPLLDEAHDRSDDNTPTDSDEEDLNDQLAADAAEAAGMAAVLHEVEDHDGARQIMRNHRRNVRYSMFNRRSGGGSGRDDDGEDTDSDVPSAAHATTSSGPRRVPASVPSVSGYERLGSDAEANHSGKSVADGSAETIVTADAPLGSADMVAPHARFYIPRQRSSVAVKFDPPVAGRYILVKLWAPCPNANIDVQSITAYGYGGPRFFPATDMR